MASLSDVIDGCKILQKYVLDQENCLNIFEDRLMVYDVGLANGTITISQKDLEALTNLGWIRKYTCWTIYL